MHLYVLKSNFIVYSIYTLETQRKPDPQILGMHPLIQALDFHTSKQALMLSYSPTARVLRYRATNCVPKVVERARSKAQTFYTYIGENKFPTHSPARDKNQLGKNTGLVGMCMHGPTKKLLDRIVFVLIVNGTAIFLSMPASQRVCGTCKKSFDF